jgi:NAD-dependent deacetylase sirtuin 4
VTETIDALVDLARGRTIVALTGAGCSTESGIPDYRGPSAVPRRSIQHREFVERLDTRRRYWARSLVGWPRLAAARPNSAHRALAELEARRGLAGVITQNVDGLHHDAGSRTVVELHGAIARVRCLACEVVTSRTNYQQRLLDANPSWAAPSAASIALAPDGDADLADRAIDELVIVPCAACGGVVMPDVVFFGGSVPKATLDTAWALFDRAELLLVAGTSLAVFSGYRFVRRAAERAIPIAIVNRGETRGDRHAAVRIDANVGHVLPELVGRLVGEARSISHAT